MTSQTYQALINEGIKGLPEKALSEILDFIFFLRKRALQPEAFEEELRNTLLDHELNQLSQSETAHLEEEFKDYARQYPK